MTYSSITAAISFSDTKIAALYFDRVIPVEFKNMKGTGKGVICNVPDPVDAEVLSQLIFGDDTPKHKVLSYLDDYWSPMINQVRPLIKQPLPSNHPDAYKELKSLYLSNYINNKNSVRSAFQKFAKSLYINSYSVLLPESMENDSFTEAYSCLTTSNIPLIDTENSSWEQIMELRKDSESKKKLRRLRLFFLNNYVGKTKDFIEDDLCQRLDDYENTRKKHGFDTAMSTLDILLDANTLQAAAVAGFTTGLFGGPIVGMASGVTIELGKVLIELGKKQANISNLSAGHELGYIISAKTKING